MTNKFFIPQNVRTGVFSRDKFTCQKCGFCGMLEDLEVHHIIMKIEGGTDDIKNLITLCSICHHFSPDSNEDFENYLKEKIDGIILDTFRKPQKSISKRTKKGMDKKARDGNLVTRAPLGYSIENKQLTPAEDSYLVQEIFQEFLNTTQSLTKLAKKYSLSVNGLKKVLTNQTYLGKIKFNGEIHEGHHKPLISSTLFNHVQNKLEKLGIKI